MAGNTIPQFTPLRGDSPVLDRAQVQIKALTDVLSQIIILQGRLIEDVAVATSATRIEHGLNREPKGWIVVDNDTASTIHSSTDALPKLYLSLIASSASTISLWVF